MMMLIDAFAPEGVTRLCVDSIFMMPHLGVLAQVHEQAATEVFERDCLIYLGTCVAPTGRIKPGATCMEYELTVDGQTRSGKVAGGEIILEPLDVGQTATAVIRPGRGLDIGAGRGKALTAELHGGVVGVVFDGRGRPLDIPHDNRALTLTRWAKALDAYPD